MSDNLIQILDAGEAAPKMRSPTILIGFITDVLSKASGPMGTGRDNFTISSLSAQTAGAACTLPLIYRPRATRLRTRRPVPSPRQ